MNNDNFMKEKQVYLSASGIVQGMRPLVGSYRCVRIFLFPSESAGSGIIQSVSVLSSSPCSVSELPPLKILVITSSGTPASERLLRISVKSIVAA